MQVHTPGKKPRQCPAFEIWNCLHSLSTALVTSPRGQTLVIPWSTHLACLLDVLVNGLRNELGNQVLQVAAATPVEPWSNPWSNPGQRTWHAFSMSLLMA
jgi:hypothetical protein